MFKINICPKPTPRPRVKSIIKNGKKINLTYYPSPYMKYKKDLCWLIKGLKIPNKDYKILWATFGVPYPKTIKGGEKSKIESQPLRNKFDCDNVLKGLMDALEDAQVLSNDNQIYIIHVCKLRTKTTGYINFSLE
jgi:Holliday junction resolvase RusA-like endonuclease